ncbi:hypothetical protein BDV93DRAFT_525747 [Ceratobasidium sp. AG-I]|nr:hypothetical protein BDV93DRAFT_525747 [Ceratobasidium sp. AG-I]
MPEFLTTVLQEWENGRAHLATAIESYVAATAALRAATASYPLWTLHYPTSTLEAELESISLELLGLEKARVVLANTRNAQCSLIDRLPSELLASIFQVAVDSTYPPHIYDSISYANPAAKLIRVCSRWRQVALATGSLWSCVVFPYQADRNYEKVSTNARIQLERTCGSSVDLFLSHKPSDGLDGSRFQSTIELIKPYMKRLRSLVVRLDRRADTESLLECCLTNGTAGTLSRLEIVGTCPSAPLFHRADSQTRERFDEYLRSVRMLKLCTATFDWRCAVFEQLSELVLCHLHAPYCPNLTQLAGVLSSSPGLRRLRLKKITIHDETEPVIQPPLKLQHLGKLILDRLDDPSSCEAISTLSLGQRSLSLTFHADFNSSIALGALRRFATENRIETFRFKGVPNCQPMQDIIESLPDLKCLVLDGLKLGESDFNALARLSIAPPPSPSSPLAQINLTSSPSQLKRLALVECIILGDQTAFKETISSLSLESFRLRDCSIETATESQGESGDVSTTLRGIDAKTELGIWLAENMAGTVMFGQAI